MAARKKPRPRLDFTVPQLTFLSAMRQFYPERSLAECAHAAKLSNYEIVSRWRGRNKRFCREMDELKVELRSRVAEKLLQAPAPGPCGPVLTEQLATYVDAWRKSLDRITAARSVDLEWAQVEEARKTMPEFDAACRRVEQEIAVQLDDARTRAALAGDGVALNALRKGGPATPDKATPAERRARVEQLRRDRGQEKPN